MKTAEGDRSEASSVCLRAAVPTLEEGRTFARYLDQAAEGFFRFWLGPRFAELVARAFLEPDHDLSHQRVTFAEKDGAIVGMVSGFTSEQHRTSSQRPLKQAVGGPPLRMTLISILLAPLFRILETIAEGDFYIQAVAVDPAARGQGVGSILLDAIEDDARAAGCARLALDVSGKNVGARRLYERRDMVVDSRWPRRLRLPPLEHSCVESLEVTIQPLLLFGTCTLARQGKC